MKSTYKVERRVGRREGSILKRRLGKSFLKKEVVLGSGLWKSRCKERVRHVRDLSVEGAEDRKSPQTTLHACYLWERKRG